MSSRALLGASLCAAALACLSATRADAGGIVGDGTAASCTEQAFDAALAGGGSVLFNCGAAPHVIILTTAKQIAFDTDIDGGGNVTLSGANATSLFQVFVDATMLIDDITLTRAFGSFGAIENFGTLTLDDSRIDQCMATASGGAVSNSGTLTLIDMNLVDNHAAEHGGAISSESGSVTITRGAFTDNDVPGSAQSLAGGAIYSLGGLTITGTHFEQNHAHAGGAIYSGGTLSISGATIVDNGTYAGGGGDGGGLNQAGATGTVTGTTFDGNTSATGYGGGVFVAPDATLAISDSTFTRNSADVGGGLVNQGTTTITGSTFYDNTGYYAALANGVAALTGLRDLTLTNVTISGNSSDSDNVVYLANQTTNAFRFVTIAGNSCNVAALATVSPDVEIRNTILAGNLPKSCESPLGSKSAGFNIADDTSCELTGPADQNAADPLLGDLADNGGPTLTQLPDTLSLAIDSGQCIGGITTDQRGVTRPQGLSCDIGAVEVAAATTTTSTTSTSISSSTTTVESSTTTSLAPSDCGDPVQSNGARHQFREIGAWHHLISGDVTASDALAILNAAVGLLSCELCVCDVDASGGISATDALTVLRIAVALPGELSCPPCD